MGECWIAHDDFKEIENARNAGGIVGEIMRFVRYYIAQSLLYSRGGIMVLFPWDPLVKTFLPEIACKDVDTCGHNAVVHIVRDPDVEFEDWIPTDSGVQLSAAAGKLYGRKGFTVAYAEYDTPRVAVCTNSKPALCIVEELEDDP